MRASQSIDDDLAGVDDIGDEFYRNMHRIARQIGADDKSHLELGGIDALVALDVQRGRRKPRLVIDDRGSDLSGNIVDPVFVDGAIGQCRESRN